jgi:hypothetical protein
MQILYNFSVKGYLQMSSVADYVFLSWGFCLGKVFLLGTYVAGT